MSFEPSTNLDDDYNDTCNNNDSMSMHMKNNKDPRHVLQPHAPPPAAPPPPLPDSANNSRSSSPLPHQQQQQQRQVGYSFYGSTTLQQQPAAPPAPPPGVTIINYSETSPASKQGKRTLAAGLFPPDNNNNSSSNNTSSKLGGPHQQPQQQQQQSTFPIMNAFRGDATLRPNIGESNAAIGEESLRESLWKGQIINVVACSLAILLQIWDFIANVLFVRPAKTVLGLYLTLFSILLLCFETGLGRDLVRQQFGLLHHPMGRSFILLQMGGLAIGQGSIVDIMLGSVFVGNGVYTMVTFCWYPAYRRRLAQDGGEEERQSILVTAREHFWANPVEATALLQKAMVAEV